MLLSIRHTTQYRYAEPALRVTQAVRLWPTACTSQRVASWQVDVEGRRLSSSNSDGFGNRVATHTADGPVTGIRIDVRGEVETRDTQGVLDAGNEPLPPEYFLYATPLTRIGASIHDLAISTPQADGDIARLHGLCNLVRDRLDYVPGQTDAQTTASQALANGAGVCQDHAHVLIAAARALEYPARYVSGYLCAGVDGGDAASHAWAEIHVPDIGWVGFDAANRICPDEHYVRLACGRDYHDAAPIRGVHQGGVEETLEVSVQIVRKHGQQ
ncbi:MAG: transglutaminase family protein [Rudaea sp.]